MNELSLAQEIAKGNQAAFEGFFNDYKLKVMNLCYGMVQDKDIAEDLTQDIFLEVFSSAKFFKGNSKLSTWLYRIAVNKTINHLRKHKIKKFFFNIDDYQNNISNNSDRIDLTIEEKENLEQLRKVINTLPSKQKTALVLFIYDELPQKEIAQIMDCSISAVEVLIHRAKQSIKKKMNN